MNSASVHEELMTWNPKEHEYKLRIIFKHEYKLRIIFKLLLCMNMSWWWTEKPGVL